MVWRRRVSDFTGPVKRTTGIVALRLRVVIEEYRHGIGGTVFVPWPRCREWHARRNAREVLKNELLFPLLAQDTQLTQKRFQPRSDALRANKNLLFGDFEGLFTSQNLLLGWKIFFSRAKVPDGIHHFCGQGEIETPQTVTEGISNTVQRGLEK